MVNILRIFFISLLIFYAEVSAQSVSALASVDSSDYLVGDYINYSLELRTDKDVEIIAPFIRDSLKEVEVIKELEPSIVETEEKRAIVYHFIVSYYDSGSVTIPRIAVKYKTLDGEEQEVLSNSVTFTVHTVPVEQQAEIKDVKEPLTIPLNWKFILLIIFIVLVLIALAIYLYLRYKKKKAAVPVKKKIITIPPHVKALAALDKLESEQLWQKGKVKEYHSNITGIVRNYFEERFELPALELTTTEQMEQLKKVSAAEIILEETNQFLNNADLVKFAKFIPIASVNEEMMKQAKKIVNKTIPTKIEKVEEELQNA
ncbi:MAG: hypothetical protein KJN64_00260 [Ignavibacteria bacterium]|nr:hypothetical protein [Ignavibacteria bacterium]MBT8380962.1 hypothetical protein [Ignavibacteria bacterium]MBT8392356.1 hypothetical protein [Ignavibacteria bacterium]NNJ53108.1 hypothetical protein [Ignavibacteriaceae bacterium]NNL22220.1 hypothetical protein [Ignavibacteriaceae bacterium]